MRGIVVLGLGGLLLAAALAGCAEPADEASAPADESLPATTPAATTPLPPTAATPESIPSPAAPSPAPASPPVEPAAPPPPEPAAPPPPPPAATAAPTPPPAAPAAPSPTPPPAAPSPTPPPAAPSPTPPPLSPTPPPPPAQGSVRIVDTQFDAPGNERANLAEEWVELTNAGDAPVDLSGWRLQDEAEHVYRFPAGFTLQPGAHVKVRTGEGTDTATDLHWGSGNAVWNNDGDTALLYDAAHALVDQRSG